MPKKAGAFEDAACSIILMLSTFLGFLGAETPALAYLADKCTIPTPNN